MNLLFKLPMNSPNTQNIQDSVYFLADDYFLNRPGAQDHMLMIANISKLDHLLHRGCEKIY
ncbi:Proline-specific peptidase [Klebsiella variicola]|nr:conserved hypothetical protein [Klebsiella quasipneumoniae subsp. quasipneumoniae]CTQ23183.1 Proline-specific peptidase [Klebsiella variicola]